MNRSVILFLALVTLASPLPFRGETGRTNLCAASSREKCYFEVCFKSYATYVTNGAKISHNYGIELDQYIHSKDSSRTPCYLVKITPTVARQLELETAIISPPVRVIDKSDIAPSYDDFLKDKKSSGESAACTPKDEEINPPIEEALILLDAPLRPAAFSRRISTILQETDTPMPELKPEELGILSLPGPTNQIKINVNEFRSQLENASVDLGSLYNRAGVLRIDPAPDLEFRSSTTTWVIQSGLRDRPTLFENDLRGKGQIIGMIDDLIDTNHCFFEGHGSRPGSNHRKLVDYRSRLARAPSIHGTLVAGILAGSASIAPEDPDGGQAPEAKIAFASVWDFAAQGPVSSALYQTLKKQYQAGARIFSNSWGDKKRRWYTNWAYDIDRFTWEKEDALVLFAIHNDHLITSPENAKNVLAVGASKQANFTSELGSGGSGLTCDGRLKPEILAPGCRIRSAAVGTTCGLRKAPSRQPAAIPKELSDVHSGQHNATLPIGHGLHSNDCATSWACPAVAGAAALARQYYENRYYKDKAPHPTGALIKATLLNGTIDMNSVVGKGGEKYPNEREGWGLLRLDNAIELKDDRRKLMIADCLRNKGFTPELPPQTQDYLLEIGFTGEPEPLKITLAWTEPPPAWIERKDPVVNDLNLRLERLDCPARQKCFFLGNDFIRDEGESTGHRSPLDGKPDVLNNVEQIVIAKPASGKYRITIEGKTIHVANQGFALVATGDIKQGFAIDQCPR